MSNYSSHTGCVAIFLPILKQLENHQMFWSNGLGVIAPLDKMQPMMLSLQGKQRNNVIMTQSVSNDDKKTCDKQGDA